LLKDQPGYKLTEVTCIGSTTIYAKYINTVVPGPYLKWPSVAMSISYSGWLQAVLAIWVAYISCHEQGQRQIHFTHCIYVLHDKNSKCSHILHHIFGDWTTLFDFFVGVGP